MKRGFNNIIEKDGQTIMIINRQGIDFEILIDGNENVVCGKMYKVKLSSYEDRIFKGELVWIYQTN